jgi:hypothetical protein
MAENKTKHTDASVEEFIAGVEHPVRQSDARTLVAMLREVSGHEPRMYGPSIIGFGDHHYRYDSGREGDTPRIAFSPRKANLVFYGFSSAPDADGLLAKLGKHKESKACVYINKLSDVDLAVLRELAEVNYQYLGTTDKG